MNFTSNSVHSFRFYLLIATVVLILLIVSYIVGRNLTLAEIQNIAQTAKHHASSHPILVFSALALTQAVGMVFSLPTKALLTLLSGALLGIVLGATSTFCGVLVGTSLLFFASRHLLREKVLRHLVGKVGSIEKRISEKPIRTMIGLRLFIALPYGPCTIAAALSSMRYREFLLGTAIGDFPVVLLYSIAGERLFVLTSTHEALSPSTVAILIVAGLAFLVGTFFSKKRRSLGSSDILR